MKGMRSVAPMGVRIPDELKKKIQEKSKENGRSMNAEIVFLLEKSFSNTESGKYNDKLHKFSESKVALIEKLKTIIQLQERDLELAYEQISLLKHNIKIATGFDIQEHFNKTVNYEVIDESLKSKSRNDK